MIDPIPQLEKQYETLQHEEGKITEIRTLPEAISQYCTTKKEFVDKAIKLIDKGLYVGINQRRDREPGTSSSVPIVSCLVLDIDPIRPKDTASSDLQLSGAIEVGTRIYDDFKGSTLVSSGSGCHVYLPINAIKVTDPVALTRSLSKWSKAIKEKYATEGFKIDSIFDLPRVIRVWGSHNSRSKRQCHYIKQMDGFPKLSLAFSQDPIVKKEPKIEYDELTQRFMRLRKANKRLKELTEGVIAFQSPSEADFEFIKILSRSEFTEEEINALWEHNKAGNKEPKNGDIRRCLDKTEDTKDVNAYRLSSKVGHYFDSIKLRRMGIRSGFNTFDETISGFKEGKIYIIGARPGTGKTTLLTQILTNMAEQGIPCLMFPTEVGAEPLVDKILSRKTKIELKKFQNGTFTPEDVSKLEKEKDYLTSLPLTIYEDFGLDIDKYEKEIDKYAPKVVCLDYFQALKWKDPASVGEKEEAVRRIKKITKDRDIITICLSQLKRNETGKSNMAELKGTGALEEYADVIVQMYPPEKGVAYPIPIDFIISKSKYSATGNMSLLFHKTTARFEEDTLNEMKSVGS